MTPINICITTTAGREIRLTKCLTAIEQNSNYPYILSLYTDKELTGCIKPTRLMLESLNPNHLAIVLNDDMVPEKDWLKILVHEYTKRFPNYDGLAQPKDTIQNGSIATCPMATPKFLLEHWRPEYHHMFGDTELTERAKYLKKYLYVPESVVVHEHLTEQQDPNYQHANKWTDIDHATYKERRARRFDLV